jgi:hypothetical protein
MEKRNEWNCQDYGLELDDDELKECAALGAELSKQLGIQASNGKVVIHTCIFLLALHMDLHLRDLITQIPMIVKYICISRNSIGQLVPG